MELELAGCLGQEGPSENSEQELPELEPKELLKFIMELELVVALVVVELFLKRLCWLLGLY